jgi:hypothetical protein
MTVPKLPEATQGLQLVRIDVKNDRFVYYTGVYFPQTPEGSRAVCGMYLRRAAICGKIGSDVESNYTVMALGANGEHDVLDDMALQQAALYKPVLDAETRKEIEPAHLTAT